MFDWIAPAALAAEEPPAPPISEEDAVRGLLVGGIVLLLGGMIELGMALKNRRFAHQSRSWPRARGTVLELKFKKPMLSGFGRYVPQVRYSYEVNGELWIHDAIRFGGYDPQRRDAAEKILRGYPVDSEVEVIYDPADPRRCALQSEAAIGNALSNGIGMLVLGGVLLVAILF